MHIKRPLLAGLIPLLLVGGAPPAWPAPEGSDDFPYLSTDHAAIEYQSRPLNDPATRLIRRVESGKLKLEYDARHGYLPSLVKNLGLNIDSQLLVFSKTSFQGRRISPAKPRALYFGDDVALGFVQDSDIMELISIDPAQGVVFYTVEAPKGQKPSFTRRYDECMSCHLIPGTLNVPGLLVTSVIPGLDGAPRVPAAGLIIDSRSPLNDRWGGWYVTGAAGELTHRGNAFAPDPERKDALDYHGTQNLTSLDRKFDTSAYLAPTSDIVALMALEHQTRATNLITRLGWETRIAQQEGRLDQSRSRLDFVAEQLAQYLLFADEAPIHDPIRGVSSFTDTFPQHGPRDKQGRSLRDFDLQTRLFRYPLSFMIYTEAFDALPDAAKDRVYRRLYDVLTGKDSSRTSARLAAQDREAALQILRETKPNLPAYWK